MQVGRKDCVNNYELEKILNITFSGMFCDIVNKHTAEKNVKSSLYTPLNKWMDDQ